MLHILLMIDVSEEGILDGRLYTVSIAYKTNKKADYVGAYSADKRLEKMIDKISRACQSCSLKFAGPDLKDGNYVIGGTFTGDATKVVTSLADFYRAAKQNYKCEFVFRTDEDYFMLEHSIRDIFSTIDKALGT